MKKQLLQKSAFNINNLNCITNIYIINQSNGKYKGTE